MTRRWLIALALSVGLNLFMAGFAVARHWRSHAHAFELGHEHPAHRNFDEQRAEGPIGALPWAVPAFKQIWREHDHEFATELRDLRQARQQVLEELGRDTLDKAAFERALAELRVRTDALQLKLHQALVEHAADLPVEERRRVRGANQRGRRQRSSDVNAGSTSPSAPSN